MKRTSRLLIPVVLALAVAHSTVAQAAAAAKFEKPPFPESSPTPSEAAPSPAAVSQGGECARVKASLPEQAKAGRKVVACMEPDVPRESDGVTTNAIQPAPSWCRTDGQWWFTRTGACLVSSGRVDVIRVDNGALVGQLFYNFIAYSYTAASISTWAHQVQLQQTSAWGQGVGSSVQGFATCSGQCNLASSNFPSQPMVNGQFANGESFHNTTATAPGAVGYGSTPFSWFFTNPGWAPTNNATITPPSVRCDNQLPGYPGRIGCVFYQYVPAIVYALGGPYPELANHIAQAQASGLPGAYPGGAPLTRLVDPVLQDRNRNVACPSSYPRPPLKSCDEYPFASTWQGASTGGGGPRTWSGCSITLPGPNSTGPVGYSVCMINDSQNTQGGSVLGLFYNDNRVLSSEAFRVWTP